MPNWLEYRSKYHTLVPQLADIANKTQPGLLIIYHRGGGTTEQYLSEMARTYPGKVVVGEDLDTY
jgi:ribonuclease BN (tRNA processing enzyme)